MKHLQTPQSLLYTMKLIRGFEMKISEAFAYGKLAGTMFHLSVGQEATAVGTIAAIDEGDFIQSHHRGHGHMIALGADIRRMMAEMFGKVDGLLQGQGRVDAHRRHSPRQPRRQRHCRGRHPHRDGRSPRAEDTAAPIMSWSVSSGRERPWRGSSTNR